jgi:hypothetical protein
MFRARRARPRLWRSPFLARSARACARARR